MMHLIEEDAASEEGGGGDEAVWADDGGAFNSGAGLDLGGGVNRGLPVAAVFAAEGGDGGADEGGCVPRDEPGGGVVGAEGEVGPAGYVDGEAHGGRVVRLDFALQLPPPPLHGPPRPAEAGEEKDGGGRPAQSVDSSCLI
jgi:hypothetical protein